MGRERLSLRRARSVVTIEIEAGLADRDDARMSRQLLDPRRRRIVEVGGCVGMAPDAGEDRLVSLGIRDRPLVAGVVDAHA